MKGVHIAVASLSFAVTDKETKQEERSKDKD